MWREHTIMTKIRSRYVVGFLVSAALMASAAPASAQSNCSAEARNAWAVSNAILGSLGRRVPGLGIVAEMSELAAHLRCNVGGDEVATLTGVTILVKDEIFAAEMQDMDASMGAAHVLSKPPEQSASRRARVAI